MIVISMPDIIREGSNNQPGKIQKQVHQFPAAAECKGAGEIIFFQGFSKRIQSDHIEDKMESICVNEAMGDESVHLAPLDGRRVEDKIIQYFLIRHPANRYQGSNDHNDQGD